MAILFVLRQGAINNDLDSSFNTRSGCFKGAVRFFQREAMSNKWLDVNPAARNQLNRCRITGTFCK